MQLWGGGLGGWDGSEGGEWACVSQIGPIFSYCRLVFLDLRYWQDVTRRREEKRKKKGHKTLLKHGFSTFGDADSGGGLDTSGGGDKGGLRRGRGGSWWSRSCQCAPPRSTARCPGWRPPCPGGSPPSSGLLSGVQFSKSRHFSETSPYPWLSLFVDRLLVIKQHLTMMIIFSTINIFSWSPS